jgi:hypothetical protein
VARRGAPGSLGVRQPRSLRAQGPLPPHELPDLPLQDQLPLLLGTSTRTRTRGSSRSTPIASPPTATCATVACSARTSTSATP